MKPLVIKFITGAFKHDFTVSMPGSYVARKGKIDVMLMHEGSPHIYVFINKIKVIDCPENCFDWAEVQVIKGKFYYARFRKKINL